MNELRPPQQCRVTIAGATYNDSTAVSENHMLTWRGEINRRCDPEKDDLWKLYAGAKWCWIELSDIQILGREPGSHTVSEMNKNGDCWPPAEKA